MASKSTRLRFVHEVTIRATPERIWAALTQGDLTKKYYYGTEIQGTIETGSAYVYYNPNGTVAADGRIVWLRDSGNVVANATRGACSSTSCS